MPGVGRTKNPQSKKEDMPAPFPQLTSQDACEALATVGLQLAPEQVQVESREERWFVRLPDDRMAWFAASIEGHRRLCAERRLLRLLQARCSFRAPRVLAEGRGGDFDVRVGVPGTADPWEVFRHVRADPWLGARIGAQVGSILAEQHTRIGAVDVAHWLPLRPSWPESGEWVRQRLPRVADDLALVAKAGVVFAMYEAVKLPEADRVLVHADVGFHNLAIDATSLAVRGLFDYDGAAWADRHHDFRYLLFDYDCDEVLEAAAAAYEPSVGCVISRARVALYNAACAISFLAHREGKLPEERCCGRTLTEDLRWTAHAIGRALALAPRGG